MEIRICRDGMMLGVYSLEEAQRALDGGELFASDLSWYADASDWQPLCDVPGIRIFKNDDDKTDDPFSANHQLAHDEPPPLPQKSPTAARIAGFWLRFLSGLIDCVLATLVSEPFIELFAHQKMAAAEKTLTAIQNLVQPLSQCADLNQMLQMWGGIAPVLLRFDLQMIQQLLPLAGLEVAIFWLYFAGLNALPWQTTPGKWLLKLKLVETDGSRVGFWRATIRFVGSVFLVGYILLPFSRKKQSLQDMIAGTLVVHR